MVDIKREVKLAFIENKVAIIASVLILFLSLVLGYVFEPYLHSYLNPVVDDFTNKVQSGVIQLTFHDIFMNNIMIVFRMFIFGIFFCFSVIILAFNGFFVGYYAALQDNLLRMILFLIPHGIFEFSSCILACSSGLVLFNFIRNFSKALFAKNGQGILTKIDKACNENFDKLKQSLILLFIAAVLMVIAGIIETYVTVPVAYYLLSIFG